MTSGLARGVRLGGPAAARSRVVRRRREPGRRGRPAERRSRRRFDWNDRYNLWSGLIGGVFLALAYFGTDQSQVQRYLTGRSIRESRRGLLFNAAAKIPMQFVHPVHRRDGLRVLHLSTSRRCSSSSHQRPATSAPTRHAVRAASSSATRRRSTIAAPPPIGCSTAHAPRTRQAASGAEAEFAQAQRASMRRAATPRRSPAAGGSGASDTNFIFLTFVTAASSGRPRRPGHGRDLRRRDVRRSRRR